MSRLIYVPVSAAANNILNTVHPHIMFNPTLQSMNQLLKNVKIYSEPFADSGGYQLISHSKRDSKRKCIVAVGAGIKNTKSKIILDPIDLCCRYKALGIKFGFTLDFPLSKNSTEKEFCNKLELSFYWASLMMDWKIKENLETKLLTAIQYSTKKQFYNYFKEMSKLNPDGFALPMRDWVFNYNNTIEFALVLSFLMHQKVKLVHLLGNSSVETIVIAAASIGLNMFEQISFDSTTWYQLRFDPKPKLINRKTLKMKFVLESDNLPLILPRSILETMGENKMDYYSREGKQILMAQNAYAISRYTRRMVRRAQDIDNFKDYILRARHLNQMKNNLITAIRVLEHATHNGYESANEWMDWIW
jgi:AraC-like DNA-binding protein